MARDRPCGCGRKLGFSNRGAARVVVQFDEHFRAQRMLEVVFAELDTDDQAQDRQAFISDGENIRQAVVDVLHGADHRIVARADINRWLSTSKRIVEELPP